MRSFRPWTPWVRVWERNLEDISGAILQARDFVQLVLSEQLAGASRDFGVVSLNTWRIGDQAIRHKLLLAGLGWGGMPEPIVRADIERGRLLRLNLPDCRPSTRSIRPRVPPGDG